MAPPLGCGVQGALQQSSDGADGGIGLGAPSEKQAPGERMPVTGGKARKGYTLG